jgi:uncharacterized membrane protein YoaT (DUF817 family)
VHLFALSRHLGSDEGGFSMVARFAGSGGGFLYGPQWVDRPPGLIALYGLAQHLGPYGARLTAGMLAVALVAALAWAAAEVGGQLAARWAAWTGFAFASSTLLGAQRLTGELAAAAFVSVSVAALIRSARASRGRAQVVLFGALAGASTVVAMLMKQNFADGLVFAAVLLIAGVATRTNRLTYQPRRMLLTGGGFVLGALVLAAVTVWWAHNHGGLQALLYAMFGFRADAAAVMAQGSWTAPLHRLDKLAGVALLSGLALLVIHLTISHRRRLRHLDPLAWAIVAAGVVELFGVFAGANFWSHYFIALIPMVALAAGLSANSRTPSGRWTRRLVVLAVVVTAVVSPIRAFDYAHTPSASYTTGRWVADSARAGDSIVVPFTHANVINASRLRPGYPYAWSLPVRTLDPHLTLLVAALEGPEAPTWVVRWNDTNSWGLDPDHGVDAALQAHYTPVAEVCGHPVWLHQGIDRQLAPTPQLAACRSSGH